MPLLRLLLTPSPLKQLGFRLWSLTSEPMHRIPGFPGMMLTGRHFKKRGRQRLSLPLPSVSELATSACTENSNRPARRRMHDPFPSSHFSVFQLFHFLATLLFPVSGLFAHASYTWPFLGIAILFQSSLHSPSLGYKFHRKDRFAWVVPPDARSDESWF